MFGAGLRAGAKVGNSTYCPGNLHDALIRLMEVCPPGRVRLRGDAHG